MKQLTYLTRFLFFACFLSILTSCEEDNPGGTGGITLPPVVELKNGVDFISSDATVDASSVFKINLSASKGDNDMTTFTVLEDGLALDASRIAYGSAGFGDVANPYALLSSEASAFASEISLVAQADGDVIYTFRMADSAGETDEVSVTISVSSDPLAIALDGSTGGLTTDVTLDAPAKFKVKVDATKGPSPMSNIAVLEDGVEVDPSRVSFNTEDDLANAFDFTANPFDLVGDEKNGISWYMWIQSHDDGTKSYTVKVTAEDGTSEEVSLAITIDALTELSGKLLLNAGGPAGTGGINLLTGDGTGSDATEAHIKDLGIDVTQPTSDWIRKIAPITDNGVTMKMPGMDFPVSDFNAVTTKAEIQQAFDSGDTIAESEVVIVGDRFLVQAADGTVFLVLITNINETMTTGDNDDYYELSIKY